MQMFAGEEEPVDPSSLLRRFYALPGGSDYRDGGQHDCEEALRTLLAALHTDLVHASASLPQPCNVRLVGCALLRWRLLRGPCNFPQYQSLPPIVGACTSEIYPVEQHAVFNGAARFTNDSRNGFLPV